MTNQHEKQLYLYSRDFPIGSSLEQLRAALPAASLVLHAWIEPRPLYKDGKFQKCDKVFFSDEPPQPLADRLYSLWNTRHFDEVWLFTENGGLHIVIEGDKARFFYFEENSDRENPLPKTGEGWETRAVEIKDTRVFVREGLHSPIRKPYQLRNYIDANDQQLLAWRLFAEQEGKP